MRLGSSTRSGCTRWRPMRTCDTNGGVTMLRRSYSYDHGLLFLGYQRDPRRQFVVLQRRLAEHDALSAFTTHVGSAVFALPPGARPGGFIGDGLLARPTG